jgi:hypothetical protein
MAKKLIFLQNFVKPWRSNGSSGTVQLNVFLKRKDILKSVAASVLRLQVAENWVLGGGSARAAGLF